MKHLTTIILISLTTLVFGSVTRMVSPTTDNITNSQSSGNAFYMASSNHVFVTTDTITWRTYTAPNGWTIKDISIKSKDSLLIGLDSSGFPRLQIINSMATTYYNFRTIVPPYSTYSVQQVGFIGNKPSWISANGVTVTITSGSPSVSNWSNTCGSTPTTNTTLGFATNSSGYFILFNNGISYNQSGVSTTTPNSTLVKTYNDTTYLMRNVGTVYRLSNTNCPTYTPIVNVNIQTSDFTRFLDGFVMVGGDTIRFKSPSQHVRYSINGTLNTVSNWLNGAIAVGQNGVMYYYNTTESFTVQITGPSPTCTYNGTVTLTATPVGGTWLTSNTVNMASYSPQTFVYSYNDGTTTKTDTFTYTGLQSPLKPSIQQVGNTLQAIGNGTTYTWYNGTTMLSNNNPYSPTSSGVFTVQSTIGTCSSTSEPFGFTLTGIEQIKKQGVTIVNTTNEFGIHGSNGLTWKVYNINGSLVKEGEGDGSIVMEVPGTYVITMEMDGGSVTGNTKFVKI